VASMSTRNIKLSMLRMDLGDFFLCLMAHGHPANGEAASQNAADQ
jgi:hypothetical protein